MQSAVHIIIYNIYIEIYIEVICTRIAKWQTNAFCFLVLQANDKAF